MKRELSDSDSEQDLLDDGCGSPMHHSGMDRKKRRGIIEKRRRDRINHSLTELKRLVPAAYEKQGSAKLEKAEILQMTVDHLKILQTHKAGFSYPDPSSIAMDYRTLGFRECAGEVARYLMSVEGLDSQDPLRLRLLSHLQCFSHQRENEMTKSRMGMPNPAANGGSTWMPAAATGGAPPGPTAATTVYANSGHPHSGTTTPVGFGADPLTLPPQHTTANQMPPQPQQQQQPAANQIPPQPQHQFPHHLQQHMTSTQICAQAPSPASNFALHHMTASSASHMHHNNNTTTTNSIAGGTHQSAFAMSQTPSPNQYQPVGVIHSMKQPYRPWGTELGAY